MVVIIGILTQSITCHQDKEHYDEVMERGGYVFRCPSRERKPFSHMRVSRKIASENKYDIVHICQNSTSTANDAKNIFSLVAMISR